MIFLCKDFGYRFLKGGFCFGVVQCIVCFSPSQSLWLYEKIFFVYFIIEISLPCQHTLPNGICNSDMNKNLVYNCGTKCTIALIYFLFLWWAGAASLLVHFSFCQVFCFSSLGSLFLTCRKALSPFLCPWTDSSLPIDLGLTQFECVVVFHCT